MVTKGEKEEMRGKLEVWIQTETNYFMKIDKQQGFTV